MTRIVKSLLFMIFLGALLAVPGNAQTINAASCNSTDVQAALNSVAADGTTVKIPAGTCTWTGSVTYNQKYSTTIQGASTINGTCAPGGTCTATDKTVITDNVSGTALTINTASGKSFRITGLTFNPSSGTPAYGAISINGSSTSVRVDHNHFNDTVNGDHTFNTDGINGVFDHNFFDSTNQANLNFIQSANYGTDGNANVVWTQPDNFGSSNFVFFENNLFQNGAFMDDCDYGARMVFRYNTVGTNARMQVHGTGSGAQRRGCRAQEIYGNTFTFSNNPAASNFAFLVMLEGGTGLAWGNTVTGFLQFIHEDVPRTNNDTYAQTPTPNGWGSCGTTLGPSNWDGNNNSTGYPCLDQVGRGAGDLLTGLFPNLVNNTTKAVTWPHQALVPWYVWSNTVNVVPQNPTHYWTNFDAVTVESRDYYLELPNIDESSTFNGTAGIGCGPAAATCANPVTQPASCTTGVGFWNATQGTLYKCSSTNTWTAYYTPYTYPHPLVTGSGSTSVAAPTNLAATVN